MSERPTCGQCKLGDSESRGLGDLGLLDSFFLLRPLERHSIALRARDGAPFVLGGCWVVNCHAPPGAPVGAVRF